ncbi:UPF0158 family protein [Paenibacillus eucommiae]|uniref:Uncharacterized protein n=1 Tax=Paenibacillus eucommiae TaxID=1355755 RepID=A0ABS4ITT8_9BACL|nr:UPF0158 family protein [Paenibacillus eucommiae]MBP1990998.1 hypothetical protein [Paenibacillus eucommiae]
MKIKAKLQDIVDGMDMQIEEYNTYLSLKTGEVVSVYQHDLRTAEDSEEGATFEHLRDWQQENMKIAVDVVEDFDNYIELPTRFDINEYDMMENFCYSLKNQRHQDALLQAIQGKGAFRRFKDKIADLDIDAEWYSYKEEGYKEKAKEWCRDNDIDFIED